MEQIRFWWKVLWPILEICLYFGLYVTAFIKMWEGNYAAAGFCLLIVLNMRLEDFIRESCHGDTE